MRGKAQKLFKVFFIVNLSLFSANAFASFFMDCEGLVTINAILPEPKPDLATNKNSSIQASITVHERTFICTGHSKKLAGRGERNSADIVLPSSIKRESLEKGVHLLVKLDYSEPRLAPSPIADWAAFKIVESIPPKKAPPKAIWQSFIGIN